MAEPYMSRRMAVDGIHLHVRSGGSGRPVLLLHGFAETGAMWDPLLPLLAREHTVIVPDLRGAGDSDKPEGGYDKAGMARDMHGLVRRLGLEQPVRVAGRERIYLEHFWNDFAADPARSLPEADRRRYANAYAQPGAMRAAMEYFRNFERDAGDFAALARTPLRMPVRVIAGEKSGGTFLIEQVRRVAQDVDGAVVPGSGHWLLEEAPDRVVPLLQAYLR